MDWECSGCRDATLIPLLNTYIECVHLNAEFSLWKKILQGRFTWVGHSRQQGRWGGDRRRNSPSVIFFLSAALCEAADVYFTAIQKIGEQALQSSTSQILGKIFAFAFLSHKYMASSFDEKLKD